MNDLKLKVKLEFWELLKMRYSVAYRTPMMVFLTLIGLGMLWVVISYFNGNYLGRDGSFPALHAGFAFAFLILIPFTIVTSTRKDLKSNKFISQNIEYLFNENHFVVTGESFNMQNSWSDLHKITELNNWFILYTSKTQALFIPKDRFEDHDKLESFRSLLKSLTVKHNLK